MVDWVRVYDKVGGYGPALPRGEGGGAATGTVPGTEAAIQYFVDSIEWAECEGIEIFCFAAFDEAWKVGAEGDVGAYWGLWDKDARPKFCG